MYKSHDCQSPIAFNAKAKTRLTRTTHDILRLRCQLNLCPIQFLLFSPMSLYQPMRLCDRPHRHESIILPMRFDHVFILSRLSIFPDQGIDFRSFQINLVSSDFDFLAVEFDGVLRYKTREGQGECMADINIWLGAKHITQKLLTSVCPPIPINPP